MKRTTLLVLLLLLFGNFWSKAYAQKVAYSENFESVGLPEGWSQTGSVWTCRDDAAVFNTLLFGAIDTLVSPVIDVSALDERAILSFGMTQAVTNNQVDWLAVLCREENGIWQVLNTYENAKGGVFYEYALTLPDNLAGKVQFAFAAANNSAGGILLDYMTVKNAGVCGTPVQNLVVESEFLTAHGAVISWAPVATIAFKGCNIKVSSVEMTDMTAQADIANLTGYIENEYILGELEGELYGPAIQPNTSYWFYIQTDCGDGDVSEWASVSFETPCIPVTAIEEGFEENKIPDCWKTFNINANDVPYTTASYVVKTDSKLKHNGNYALFFNNSTTNRSSYVFTPEIEDLSSKQISFWAASAATSNSPARVINVALASTQSYTSIEKSTVKTFILPEYNGQWYELTVSFKGYIGNSKYIVIYTDNALNSNAVYVDDVVVSPASDCPKPFFPGTGMITSNTAEIMWVAGGTETAWNLILSTAPITDFTGVTAATDGVVFCGEVTSNPYTVTGLQPSTNYWYYIQNVCAGSDWAPCTAPLKTTKAMTVPYVEHFDQMLGVDYATANATNKYQPQDEYVLGCRHTSDYSIFCTSTGAHYGKGVTGSTTVSPYVIANTYNHEESPYYKASLCMTSSSSARSFIMLPAVPGYEVKELMLTFYVCSTAKGKTVEVGVCEELNNNIAQGQMLGAGGKYQKVGEFTTANASSTAANAKWEKVEIPLGSYLGKGKFITIMGKAESSTIYIDDITISETPACYKVANVEGTPVSPSEVRFSWIEQGKAAAWDVNWSSVPLDDPNVAGDLTSGSIVVTSATEYLCTNLQPGTDVYCYVRPHDCDVEWQMGLATSKYTIAALPWFNYFSADDYKTTEAFSANATGIAAPHDMVVGTLSDYRTPAMVTPYITNTAWTNAPDTVAKNSLVFKVMAASSTGAYAVLPEYTGTDPLNDLTLGFYGYYLASVKIVNTTASTCTAGSLKVGVAETDRLTSLDDITCVATVKCTAPGTPEYFTVPLTNYTGTGKFIVLYTDTVIPNNFAVDNLKLSSSNDPQRVSDVRTAGITTTTVDLVWKENGKAVSWNVRYYEGRVSDPVSEGGTTVLVTGGNAKSTLTQLKAGTFYTVFVQSVSGERTGDWSAPVEFYTECAVIEIGDGAWTEDFNSYDAGGGASEEWTGSPCYGVKGNIYNGKEYHPYVYPSLLTYKWITDHTNGTDGGNVLSLTAATTNTYNALILPEFADPVNTLQLRFYGLAFAAFLASSGTYGWAMIGVWDEETDSFDEVYEFKCEKAQTWQECTVAFDNYKGKGKRIAIVGDYEVFKARGYRGTGKTSTLYLDDMTVSKIPTCRRVAVVTANAVDSVSAQISWRKAAAETSWNVKVSTTLLDNPVLDEAPMVFNNLDINSLKLTELNPGTVYYVYVQAQDAVNDCVSEWSQPLQFQTLWQAFPLPFTLPLTNAMKDHVPDACITHSEDISSSAGISVQTSYAKVNGENTPVVQMGSSMVGKDNYLILPLVQIDDVRKLQLTLNVTSHSSSAITYYEVGVTTDPYYISTYMPVVRDSVDGRVYKTANTSATWETKIYDFLKYKEDNFGKQGKYITIRLLDSKSVSNGNMGTSRLSFHNITISKYSSCIQPMNLTIDTIATDSVRLSWTDQVKNATFEVRLFTQRPVASVAAEGITADDINRVPYVQSVYVTDTLTACLKDLLPNTSYYAAVRMACDDNEASAYTNVVSFRTRALVPQPVPYTETFENIQPTEAGVSTVYHLFPDNWEMVTGTTGSDYSGVVNGNQYEGKAACVVYKNNMLVTPRLDIESMDNLFLYCYAAECTNNYKLQGHNVEVYAVADNYASESDATLVQVVHLPYVGNTTTGGSMAYNPLYVDLSTYKGDYKRIGLKVVDYNMRFDLLTIGDSRAVWQVQNLEEVETADTWTRVKFIELNSAQTSWIAEYGPRGFKHGEGTEVVLTSTTDTVKGLLPNTAYDVYVRSNTDGAEWSSVLRIYTTTPVLTIPPYEDDFSNADTEWQFRQYAGYTNYLWMYRTIRVEEPATYQVTLDLEAAPAGHSLNAGIVPLSYTIYDYRFLNSPVGNRAHNLGLGTIGNSQEHREQGCASFANAMAKDTALTVKTTFTKPGLYRLMVLYQASSSTVIPVTKPVPLKSLVFDEYLCLAPQDVKLTALSDTAASFAWQGGQDNSYEVIVANSSMSNPYLLPEDAPERYEYAMLDPQTTTYTIKNKLRPRTKYSFYVRSICEAGTVTDFVEIPFETTCAKVQLPLREDFDVEPGCWIYDPTTTKSDPQYDEWNHQYSFEEGKIEYNVMLLKQNGLLVVPEFDEELNNLRVRFSAGYGSYNTTSNETTTIIVGAMANTFDESTFEAIATYSVPCKTSGSGVVGHLFVDVNLRLNQYTGAGKVLAFKAGSSCAVFIDWVEISSLPEFLEPLNVSVNTITRTEAVVNWIPGEETSWKVRLNGQQEFETDHCPYTLTGLTPGEDYTVEVAAVYTNGVSAYTEPVAFATLCATQSTPFTEDFSQLSLNRQLVDLHCWSVKSSEGTIDDVAAGTAVLTPVPFSQYYYGWQVPSNDREGLYVYSYENYRANRWLVAPEVLVPENGVLSFDACAYTANAGNVLKGVFAIAVSTDDGATWRKETVIANNTFAVNQWKTLHVGLSHYAGQPVRFAFYHGVSVQNSVYLRLDNVHINCVDTLHAKDTACTGYAYENGPFVYTAEEITAVEGKTLDLQKFVPIDNGCDQSMNLQLYVDTVHSDTVRAFVCDGGFVYDGQEYGVGNYRIPFQTEQGCDGWRYIFVLKDPDCLGTALENLNAEGLGLYPNPVQSGTSCLLERKFTDKEKEGLTLRIYDATGKLVQTSSPALYPVVLQVPGKAGIYMVRLTTGLGNVISEKLIVK